LSNLEVTMGLFLAPFIQRLSCFVHFVAIR